MNSCENNAIAINRGGRLRTGKTYRNDVYNTIRNSGVKKKTNDFSSRNRILLRCSVSVYEEFFVCSAAFVQQSNTPFVAVAPVRRRRVRFRISCRAQQHRLVHSVIIGADALDVWGGGIWRKTYETRPSLVLSLTLKCHVFTQKLVSCVTSEIH